MESQKRMMVFVFGLVAALFLQSVAAQTVHVVGGSTGWIIPSSAQVYVTWASSQTFVVGDTLTFNFATGQHDVVEVPKASFDSCSESNAIETNKTGPANVTLTTAGEHYYICTVGTHCNSGQKLAVTVAASATAPGTAPSAPSPSTTTTTPGVVSEPPSSSPVVQAGFALCLVSLVVGFLF